MQKKRKCMVMTGMMVFMLAVATGCGSVQEADREAASEVAIPVAKSDQEDNVAQRQSDGAQQDASESSESGDRENSSDTTTNNSVDADAADNNNKENSSQEIIGGKIRSIAQESFVISRTLVDDNGYITMPEAGSPDEQLVTIRCTDATVFEHWTIQGGGAGIEKREAVFSDIEEGGGLEAEGYFDGEDFVANKVIIEVYK